jgi:hypothetical protein
LRVWAYGPLVVSTEFFRTCPEANARSHKPGKQTNPPISRDFQFGFASQR